MKEVVSFALMIMVCLFVLTRCGPSTLGTSAAESAYTAALVRCIDESATREEARGCRHAVNLQWGIVETARDGGQ